MAKKQSMFPIGEWMPIERVKRWDKNPRLNADAIQPVAASIARFGFVAPIVIWTSKNRMVAGHTRLSAIELLLSRDPTFTPRDAPGPGLVPVRMHEFDSEGEADAYALADNKLGEIAQWNEPALAHVIADLSKISVPVIDIGWNADDLAALEVIANPPAPATDVAPLHTQDLPIASVSGQVYELGPHRLVCGDSTDKSVWALLMREELADMVWTDPPYGVSYVGGNHSVFNPEERKALGGMTIENDDLSAEQLYALISGILGNAAAYSRAGAAWYVAAPAGPLHNVFGRVLIELDIWRRSLVWVKDRFVLGRGDYHYKHEPIFYGWKPGAGHYFVDDKTLDSLLVHPRPKASPDHPTTKPISLVAECIRNSSKAGWIVVDPCGGSGTTLLASAQEGRVARLIEKSPKYCDAIRRRWTAYALEAGIDAGPGALAPRAPTAAPPEPQTSTT